MISVDSDGPVGLKFQEISRLIIKIHTMYMHLAKFKMVVRSSSNVGLPLIERVAIVCQFYLTLFVLDLISVMRRVFGFYFSNLACDICSNDCSILGQPF